MSAGAEFAAARALHQQGRGVEAARAYERILVADPQHLDTLILLGVLRLGMEENDAAEALLRRAVAIAPQSPQALGNLAAVLQAAGRHDEAAVYYERALSHDAAMLDARFGLAACRQAIGRNDAAVACYEAILAAQPDHAEANYGLATLLLQLGRAASAAEKFRAALAADPDFAEAAYGLGKVLCADDAFAEAVPLLRQALDVDPDYIEARWQLGLALARLERRDEAMAAFQAVLAAEPDHAEAHVQLGTLLDLQRRHVEAIAHYRTVLASRPDHFDALGGLANALKNIGRHDEALGVTRRMLALRPDSAPAAGLAGTILAELGSMQEAMAQFRHAVAHAPDRAEFLYYVTQIAEVRAGDEVVRLLEALLPRAASLSAHEQTLLHFALAKAYDDSGDRDRGFAHLLRGNAIKRAQINYDEAATLAGLAHLARVFTPELMAGRSGQGDPSDVPVFIVGMPRSGTTLVEQILASHQEAFGAGERHELGQAVRLLSATRIGASPFPEAVWTMGAEDFRRIGADYVAALRSLAPRAARVTDKMPVNFMHAGLIHLILPRARIIHVVRDPVDTCLSNFSKVFTGEQPFAYDLGELGRFHRAYQALMAHWRSVLPPGVMLEVEYEALVDDLETEARRIVAFCGLMWEPPCLEFHRTERAVHTASMMQVRQPIYRSSVGRWRPDAAILRPLLEGLRGGRDPNPAGG